MQSKKTILPTIIVALSLLSVPAFSQIKFGVKAGVEMNNPTFSSEAFKVENLTSYQVGPVIEVMFPFSTIDFGFEAALLYSDNRMTVSNLTAGSAQQNVSNRYLNLPVSAKVKIPLASETIKLYANAGPYAGYLISGNKINFDQINQDIKARQFKAGANMEVGLEIFKMVQVGVNYKVQLTDNYATNQPQWDDPLNGKSQKWSITAAVYF